MINYYIEVIAEPDDPRRRWLSDAIDRELSALGVTGTLSVECTESAAPDAAVLPPCVYFASPSFTATPEQSAHLDTALNANRLVIPVVADALSFTALVPPALHKLNAAFLASAAEAVELARTLLEELGIEEKQRRAFISHRREDGLAAAAQLHDLLSQHGFDPFIDRFHIRSGQDVQAQIADQLEDCALLILLETPAAHASGWVFYEVDYALSHSLGLQIISWPGTVKPLPGTPTLMRQKLAESDLRSDKGYDIFTSHALDRILRGIEAEHARAMASRRRYLLVSAKEAASEAGRQCTILPGWRLAVTDATTTSLVQVTPRLPVVDDLFTLDAARDGHPRAAEGILMHAARRLPADRRKLLTWARASRPLSMLPENAIGAYWGHDGA